jgi:Secretion system C-terminal sorting domain/PKD domain
MKKKLIFNGILSIICMLFLGSVYSQVRGNADQDLIDKKIQYTNNLLSGKIKPQTSTDRFLLMAPEQDCSSATAVCTNTYSQASSYMGGGNVADFPSGNNCLATGETNSVWYVFTVTQDGVFTFTLNTPNDYDFALYDLTGTDCGQISSLTPVRCNYSGTQGTTGLTAPAQPGNISIGAGGSPFMPGVNVMMGQTYALIINNYTGNSNGYDLSFGGTAGIFDNIKPTVTNIAAACAGNTITVTLSEPVKCSSVSAGNFSISGPSAATITSITGVGCNATTIFCTQVLVTYSGATANGVYSLNSTGTAANALRDACDNAMAAGSTSFSKLYPFTITGSTYCIGGSAAVLKLNPTPPTGATVLWSTGQTGNSISVSPTTATSYTATVTLRNCVQRASYSINPLPCDPCVLANNKPNFNILSTIYNSNGQGVVSVKDISTTNAASFPYVKWSWGDNSGTQVASPGATVSHTYANPGTYIICLHMQTFPNDSTCCHDSICKTIVIPPPSCAVINSSFNIMYPTLCATANCCVKVTHSSFYTPVDINWNWGDGTWTNSSTNPVATHTYPADGWYKITMYVTYRAPWNPELCCYKKVEKWVCIYRCSGNSGGGGTLKSGDLNDIIPDPYPCDEAEPKEIVTDISKDEYIKALAQASFVKEAPAGNPAAKVAGITVAAGNKVNGLSVIAAPNPASRKVGFTVKYTKNIDGVITIFDLKGVALANIKARTNATVNFDLAGLSPGVYLYTFSSKEVQSGTNRLVVNK